MKGAEAYVNDQWQSSGLANLPQESDALTVTLKFIVPRAAQTTGLLNHIAEVAQRRLEEAYRAVTSVINLWWARWWEMAPAMA